VDFLRSRSDGMSTSLPYVKGVVFPGKEFMVGKYDPQPLKGSKNKRGSGSPLEFVRPLTEVRGRFWWLWYPYRYYCGLRGLWLVITGTSTSSVTSTEEKKI